MASSGIPGLNLAGNETLQQATAQESASVAQHESQTASSHAIASAESTDVTMSETTTENVPATLQENESEDAKTPAVDAPALEQVEAAVNADVTMEEARAEQPDQPVSTEGLLTSHTPSQNPEPSITDDLEAMLNQSVPQQTEVPATATHAETEKNAESSEESDSSDSDSDSDSDSSEDSSDEEDGEGMVEYDSDPIIDSDIEDDDSEIDYPLLSVEETARILMEVDGGSDDEGDSNNKSASAGQLKTKNEQPEAILPIPDVTITPEMAIEPLGTVQFVVENSVVVKGDQPGEQHVFDRGSVLCLENRTVIGAIHDVIGQVVEPFYTISYEDPQQIEKLGIVPGTKVFYPPMHVVHFMTAVAKKQKGSDASNIHDEEVSEDEVEFSDDEAELAHKQKLKQKKLEKKGGGKARVRKLPAVKEEGERGLNYDDDGADDEGPYKPLARPAGFASGQTEASVESDSFHRATGRDNRDRGGFRGRGRGRGGRGRFGDGYSQPRGQGRPYDQNQNVNYTQTPHVQSQGQGQGQANTYNPQAVPPPPFPVGAYAGFPPPPPPPIPGQPYPQWPNFNFGQQQQQQQQQQQAPQMPFSFPGFPQANGQVVPPPPPGWPGAAGTAAYYNTNTAVPPQQQQQQQQQQPNGNGQSMEQNLQMAMELIRRFQAQGNNTQQQ